MATFSINQVTHAFVAAGAVTPIESGFLSASVAASGLANVGDIVVGNVDGITPDKVNLWFAQKGKGGIIKTDAIKPSNVLWVRKVAAAKMKDMPKAYNVALASAVNSGNPIVGQDYIITLTIEQFMSPSNEDKCIVHGSARAFAGDTAITLMGRLVASLKKSVDRMYSYSPVSIVDNGDGTMTVTEQFPYWELGKFQYTRSRFYLNCGTVLEANTSIEVIWGTITEKTAGLTAFHNGAKLADLEYFTLGARGSEERGMGWPYNMETKGLLDETAKDSDYDVLQIHYAYVGSGNSCQKSEKDIVFIGATAKISALATAVTAVFTAAGLPDPVVAITA